MKKLEGLAWRPRWVTHLGCLHGCLDHLGVETSEAWVSGVSGHAFVLNVHEELCPSGPTAWQTEGMLALFRNLGCESEIVFSHRGRDDFEAKRELAWESVRRGIDAGLPCYGWELGIPEYYVVHGYDDDGYLFGGPCGEEAEARKPWRELGESPIGVIEMFVVSATEPPPAREALRGAVDFARKRARGSEGLTFARYAMGLDGYDQWIAALRGGAAHGLGAAYNAAVWAECREHAAAFLDEARGKVAERLAPALDEAAGHYAGVARHLEAVAAEFPFLETTEEQKDENARDRARCARAVESLEAARRAEADGLAVLEGLAAEL
jgi:hypothetical protein